MRVDERVTAAVSVCDGKITCGLYFDPDIATEAQRACEKLLHLLGFTGEHTCQECSFSAIVPLRIEVSQSGLTAYIAVPIYDGEDGVEEALEAMEAIVLHIQRAGRIDAEPFTRAIRDPDGEKVRIGLFALRQIDGVRIALPLD